MGMRYEIVVTDPRFIYGKPQTVVHYHKPVDQLTPLDSVIVRCAAAEDFFECPVREVASQVVAEFISELVVSATRH